MQIQLLNETQAETIHRRQMTRDFPEAELKPFSAVRGLMRRGLYEPLALYEEGSLVSYAWQTVLPDCATALLDYFAVLPELRGKGAGTRSLHALAEYYAPRKRTLLIECEHPAEAPDPAEARRRIGFYLHAGARATAMEGRVFGVRYQIYALPCGGAESDAVLRRDLEALYRAMVSDPYYRGNVIFYGG
ncbi:GNAT family N-acetyltransferase [uncultured Gemmiger sp.]|uniref:GNAT family N-acetyltransferase n=1 Tax=uncultured Gemmiger sp. TaxID=1623490 RepID=UPI0025D1BF67|nr:GNAT family N-acetyltransferase [uncultured Gemmiger sp.]